MEVKVIFLPDSPLVLSLLKHKDCMGILEKKKVMNNFIPNYMDLINFKFVRTSFDLDPTQEWIQAHVAQTMNL